MALLQRTRVLSQQRLDLPDFNNLEDFVCADFKAMFKNSWTNANFVLSGFAPSGIGTDTLSIALANSVAIVGADDGVMYIGAPSLAALTTNSLTDDSPNYIELIIEQDTGGSDSRAFWDQTANSGAGAEFSQIIDTFTFIKASFAINTAGFTSDPDKIPICNATMASGTISTITDGRDMLFRLGRASSPTFDFSWASRTEPATSAFTGADKDIEDMKEWMDAVMSRIRELDGGTYWYENSGVSLSGGFRNTGLSLLTGEAADATFAWDAVTGFSSK